MYFRVSAAALAAMLVAAPAHAISTKEKMETCKFGADDQKLTGKEQKAFISKCMAKGEGPSGSSSKTSSSSTSTKKSKKKTATTAPAPDAGGGATFAPVAPPPGSAQ